jgi:hypothetical protein
MSTKRAPKSNDPTVTEGVGPEADDETKARLAEADEANIAANESIVGVDDDGYPIDKDGNRVAVASRVGGPGRVGAIATTTMKNTLASAYATAATHAALFTADPGSTGTATGEVTATGSPAYARKPFTAGAAWSAASNGVVTASVTFDVPAGTTVTFVAVCSSVTQGAATVLDKIAITSQNFATQGTLTVNFTFTQS